MPVQLVQPKVLIACGRHRILAAILALLLGNFGVHRFYVGQTGLGVLYLLFSWTFVPGFVAFLEGVYLLMMSDVEFELKYNRKLGPPTQA